MPSLPGLPRRRHIALLAGAMIVGAAAGSAILLARSGSEAGRWIFQEKIRAGYTGDPLRYVDASSYGLNTLIYNVGRIDPSDPPLDTLREIGERCRERGMHFFVSIYWLTRSYLSEGSWRKSATQDGFVDQYAPPCPLDEEYISRIIEAQSVALAKIARECNIDGIVYDGELYGAWPTRYSNKTCFCDHCFYSFLESIGRKDKVEPARRRSWLLESKALDRYYSYQGKRLASILSKIAKECRQYDRDLVFGLLGNSLDNWYVEAMARSMSAKGLPFLILDETSYVRGFSRSFGYGAPAYRLPTGLTYPEYMTRKIARKRLNAVWVGGLWVEPWFYPATIRYHLFNLATRTGGYWLFYLSPYTTNKQWVDAYGDANKAIDEALSRGTSGQVFRPNRNFFAPMHLSSSISLARNFEPAESPPGELEARLRLQGMNKAVLFERPTQLVVDVSRGTGDPCLVAAFNSSGKLICSCEIRPGESLDLASSFASSEPPYLVASNSTVPYTIVVRQPMCLLQPVTLTGDASLYWLPPENQSTFQAYCTGSLSPSQRLTIEMGTAVLANLSTPETLSFPTFQVPDAQRGHVCKITLSGLDEPVTLSLKSWAPFLSPVAVWVAKPKS